MSYRFCPAGPDRPVSLFEKRHSEAGIRGLSFLCLCFLVVSSFFHPIHALPAISEAAVLVSRLDRAFRYQNPLRVARKFEQHFMGLGNQKVSSLFSRVREILQKDASSDGAGDSLDFQGAFDLVMEKARGLEPDTISGLSIEKLHQIFEKLNFTFYMSKQIPRLFHVSEFHPPGQEIVSVRTDAGSEIANIRETQGFPERVMQVPLGREHTFNDFEQYLFDRIPEAIIADLVESNRKMEFHFFPAELSFRYLMSKGYSEFYRIGTVSGLSHKGLYIAARADGSDPIYVANHIFGLERLWHVMLNLRLAASKGRRVGTEQVRVATTDQFSPEMTRLYYDRALSDMPSAPDVIIINYQNSILRALKKRKTAMEFQRILLERFGPNPWNNLITSLVREAEEKNCDLGDLTGKKRALKIIGQRMECRFAQCLKSQNSDPRAVFKSACLADTLFMVWEFLRDVRVFLKDSAVLNELHAAAMKEGTSIWFGNEMSFAKTTWDGVLNRSTFRFDDSSGVTHDAAVFRCVWGGDSIEALGKVLASRIELQPSRREPCRIIHLGTAGSADPSHGVGTVHVPEAIFEWNFERVDRESENDLLDFVRSRGERRDVLIGARLLRVWSPLVESMDFLDKMRRMGLTTVEVEVAALHRILEQEKMAGRNLSLASMMIITDLLGSEMTLEQHGTSNVTLEMKAFDRAFEYLLEYLDISDLRDRGDLMTQEAR